MIHPHNEVLLSSKNELRIHQLTQMKLKNNVLSKRSWTLRVHTEKLRFYEVLKKANIYSKHVKLKGEHGPNK